MDASRIAWLSRTLVTRVSRRTSLGLAATGVAALGLTPAADAKKKRKKKITLCFNRQTVKKPKKSAQKLLKRGATKGACGCGSGGSCFAFVTEAGFTGSSFSSIAGADASCQEAASNARLPGTYKAWLSAGDSTPVTRFTNTANAGPYVQVGTTANGGGPNRGPVIAGSFSEILACAGGTCLDTTITITEKGELSEQTPVWTGTQVDGSASPDTCGGWTSDAGQGLVGNTNLVNASWTDSGLSACSQVRPVFCFQQAT